MCHQSGQSVTRQFLTAKPSHTCLGLAPASRLGPSATQYAIRLLPSCLYRVCLRYVLSLFYHRASPNQTSWTSYDRFGPLHCDRTTLALLCPLTGAPHAGTARHTPNTQEDFTHITVLYRYAPTSLLLASQLSRRCTRSPISIALPTRSHS